MVDSLYDEVAELRLQNEASPFACACLLAHVRVCLFVCVRAHVCERVCEPV